MSKYKTSGKHWENKARHDAEQAAVRKERERYQEHVKALERFDKLFQKQPALRLPDLCNALCEFFQITPCLEADAEQLQNVVRQRNALYLQQVENDGFSPDVEHDTINLLRSEIRALLESILMV